MTALPGAILAASLAAFVGGVLARSPQLTAVGCGGSLAACVLHGLAGDGRPHPSEVAERLLREVGEEDDLQ